ncbi:hypothetical protein RBU49_08545 [Clostridium sp. MB40-C1]|uniref:hypothetical protein n=1 Tax=Clostridium sp. MB40-C1 TaxID=3070996 RepID=UPI0027E20B49|nr:hypothetical protein [Clostridium sp. MB40-C1]WMJ82281.1 hypothetical protein RBU49_08545 [Clostridium sp. MB40-C1]
MKRKINLKACMIMNIISAVSLVILYWMCVRTSYDPIFTYLQYVILAGLLISSCIVKKNQDIVDEYAKEVLSKANNICFKLTYVIFGILLLPCILINTNSIFIGYGIVSGLAILTILRSIIFCVLDYRGM